jgi:DNA polymerase I-like protein with 3'-5' exonuclease and polymerase domains
MLGDVALENQIILESPSLVILIDRARPSALSAGQLLWGWEQSLLAEKCARAGFLPKEVVYESIYPNPDTLTLRLNSYGANVIVALDEESLRVVTGKRSIWKWHLSPLDAVSELTCRKVVPSFHPDQIRKQPELGLYLELALRRAREESGTREFNRKPQRFLLNPRIEETLSVLESLQREQYLSIDIETGRGQINTVGFAWSASDAIAINVLPESFGPANYYRLWQAIHTLLTGPSRKIYQNALYEVMCFSRYGIQTDVWHDTMLAQKFLWPELDKGLDNVGRLYTKEPYWKDDGKTVSAGKSEKKDWGNIRDWPAHYTYNCRDTANTFEACFNQRRDIEQRGKLALFDNYLMRLFEPVSEMCLRGLPLDNSKRNNLQETYEAEVTSLVSRLSNPKLNPSSPKQKLKLFKDKGYQIPKSRGPDGKWKESTDELSLKKMLLKNPGDKDIPLLLKIAELQKALSSYIRVETNPFTKRVHYSLDICGTETLRFSCRKDPFDQGFNAQTLPSYFKPMIAWPNDLDQIFIQCDLKQAESRFVAYDTADTNLIAALEDPKRDIHSEVAHQIIQTLGIDVSGVSKEEFKKKWRQLGKKSGHGSNYAMQEGTFIENCLKEMDIILTKKEATAILEAYHALFPGIRRGHRNIEKTLWNERKLTNPLGLERYFYSRLDAATFREAYAYRPQSTIPAYVNHLMLALWRKRKEENLDFGFLLQCHDSLTLCAPRAMLEVLADFCLDVKTWAPKIKLAGGDLVIPTSVEWGKSLGEMEEYGKKAT